jgi:hypothetical protein
MQDGFANYCVYMCFETPRVAAIARLHNVVHMHTPSQIVGLETLAASLFKRMIDHYFLHLN